MTDENDNLTEEMELTNDGDATEADDMATEGAGGSGEDLEAEGEQPEAEEAETEEIEIDGKKYAIPAELKDKFLMQQDYTRKTQEVAELRKAAEAERAAIQQAKEADEQALEIRADLRHVDKSLKQYENVDWARFAAEAPADAQAAMMQLQQLQMQRQQLADGLAQHEQASSQAREQANQAALAQAHAQLLQAIPDFNRDLAVEIRNSTVSAYGFSPEEVSAIADPRQVQVLRDAMLWRKSQASAKKATQPKPAKPIKTVKPTSKATVNPDKMTTAEWMEYERKRIANKR